MLTLKLAFRNILRNKRRTALTIMTMSGGMLLLIFALSTVEGSYDHLIKQFTADGVGHIQLVHQNYLEDNKQSDFFVLEPEKLINGSSLDLKFSPRVESFALVYGQDASYPSGILGVDWAGEQGISKLASKIIKGNWPTSNEKGAIISSSLAQKLSVDLGNEIALIGQAVNGSIATDLFEIIGIIDLNDGGELNLALVDIQTMREYLELPRNAQHRIIVLGRNYMLATTLASQFNQTLPVKIVAKPWQEVEDEFYQTMQADKEGNQITIVVIMFMVALGVLNTLLMATMERTKEYGVLRSIGTTPIRLASLIMTEATLMALIASLIAITLAIPLIYYLVNIGIPYPEPIDIAGFTFTHIKGSFNLEVFLTPAILLIFSSLLVSFIPAIRLLRLTPLEAMRQ